MVALFKNRSPATIIWLFILSLAVHSHFFVDSPTVQPLPHQGLLSLLLNAYSSVFLPSTVVYVYHAIIILQALRLNYLFTDHRMFNKVNYLVAMVYVLLTGLVSEWGTLNPALIANSFIIWLLAKILRLYNSPNPKTLLFNIGLIIGVSALCYQPSALLLVVAAFAVLTVRPFAANEWLVLLMGAIAPYYFLASFLYLNSNITALISYIPAWKIILPVVRLSTNYYVTFFILITVLLTGVFYWQNDSRTLLIQVKKYWSVLLFMLLIMLFVPVISKNAGIQSLLLSLVPASPFIAKGFLSPKSAILPALMFWSLLALAVINTWALFR